MIVNLLLAATIIIACVLCNKLSNKIGMPMLLAFILLGMLFGSDGLVKIQFDNYVLAEQICSIALVFIMFYGGFGTKWSMAKPVAPQAILLSSLGTLMTAGIVGLFCHYILKIALLESFLIGSVISSTDAASVFSILRSKRLNLRHNTASLLEVESGSNDPFSYMLTIIVLTLMSGKASIGEFILMLLAQIVFGVVFGVGLAFLARLFLNKLRISSSGFTAIALVAIAVITYAAPSYFGGNGYLSAYIAGIILGNCTLSNKQELVHFFDGTTGLMQMLLFFLLGLLSSPSQLPSVAVTALFIALFLTFIARPLAVFLILRPFKSSLRQQLLVSWAGMRGAASIVFAIMVVIDPVSTNHDIFHMVFFIVLFSILLQGTLLPWVAKLLGMTDPDADVMKTFNDYLDDSLVCFLQFTLPEEHPWIEKKVCDLTLPPDSLFALLIRDNVKSLPTGQTVLQAGDTLILGGLSFDQAEHRSTEQGHLFEMEIELDNKWLGKSIAELNLTEDLIVFIKRDKNAVIPNGDTVIMEDDVLVLAHNVKAQ